MWLPRLALFATAWLGPTASAHAAKDGPAVEIVASAGAVDGPEATAVGRPKWERVRLELRVKNRLAQNISDLEVELSLVPANGAKSPIPGWSFRVVFPGDVVPARAEADLPLERTLPARRNAPPSDEIAYRVTLLGYRIRPPDLSTAIELVGSPHRWDQRAASLSFDEAAADALTTEDRTLIRDEVALALGTFVPTPAASDALRMLLAIRTVGSLGMTPLLPHLLVLPERLDRSDWGRAMIELGNRMVAASEPGDPRLEVLPPWAREQSALLTVKAEDALPDAVRDAVLQLGDRAVPGLLTQTQQAETPAARRRAQGLLSSLGRATIRSQLQIRDTKIKVQVVRALGRLGSDAPIPALVDLLFDDDPVVAVEVRRTLEDLGARAVPALLRALGQRNDQGVFTVLRRLGRRHPAAVQRAVRSAGYTGRRQPTGPLLVAVRAEKRRALRAALTTQIEGALDLGRTGDFSGAFSQLDVAFRKAPDLYMQFASEIAALYRDRARLLYISGNYDAAIRTAKTGLSVQRDDGTLDVLADAQLALVFGFIQLGDLPQASEVLDQVPTGRRTAQTERMRSELWAAHARSALEAGEYSLARALVDRARALRPDVQLDSLHRRLLIVENYAVIIIMAMLAPALFLAVFVAARQRWQRDRIRQFDPESHASRQN